MAEVVISGDSVLTIERRWQRIRNIGARTFLLGDTACSCGSALCEAVVLQTDVMLDCGATETAGGVEAVQILVDAVPQVFLNLSVKWILWTDRGFVLPMATGQGFFKSTGC